ncbi:unnamed protein product [Malus baccata var. baccata]
MNSTSNRRLWFLGFFKVSSPKNGIYELKNLQRTQLVVRALEHQGRRIKNFPVGHPSWDSSYVNSLYFGVPMEPEASGYPKGLMLGRDKNIHIRLTGSTPMGDHEAFWELTGFGFYQNSEVKRVRAKAIPRWVTYWEVLM